MLHPSYTLNNNDGIYAEYDRLIERKAFENFITELPNGGRKKYLTSLSQMYLELYESYLQENKKKDFLDKTPRYYLIANELIEIFPDAKYILLIRNPLAMFSSIITTWTQDKWFNLANFKYDLFTAIEKYLDILENKKEFFYVLHYEELLMYPEKTVKDLCKKLNIEYQEEMLSYFETNNQKMYFGDPVNVYSKKGIDNSNINSWEKNLSNPQIWRVLLEYLEFIGKDKYEKLGYDYDENYAILMENIPLENIDKVNEKTFSLFSFMDNTRDALINRRRMNRLYNETTLQLNEQSLELTKVKNLMEDLNSEVESLTTKLQKIKISKKNKLANIIAWPYI
jgi:hypothetical protein